MKYLIILIIVVISAVLFAWSQYDINPSTGNDTSEINTESETGSMTDLEETTEDPNIVSDGEKTDLVGSKAFSLDGFNYGFSEETIIVNEGDTVTVNFTSAEGLHDWVVDEFDAATTRVSEGETVSVTFVADTAGQYEFYCSVGNHRALGMVGTLIVQ